MNINGTPDLGDAIWHLKNDAQYTIGKDGLSSLVWLDGNPTNITNSQIETKLVELETAHTNNAYQRDRLSEYPNLQEAIHALLDGGNTLTELQAKRTAIKTKYPKSGA